MEPEFASIVSAAIDLLSPRYRVSCFDACARHPRQQRSEFEVRNGRRRLGVGPKGHVAAIHLHSAYAAKPHAEQRNALHSHLGWDLGR